MKNAGYSIRVLPSDLGQALFAETLKRHLQRAHLSPYAASLRLKKAKNWVSMLIKGDFLPTVPTMLQLMQVLEIDGAEEQDAFLEVCYLAHTPNWITRRYLRYQRRKSNA